VRPYCSSERWVSVQAQALPAVPDNPRTMRSMNCSALGANLPQRSLSADFRICREERRKLLDSRGVLGQFLLGIIVDFLT
jgi:hypothetical protein